VFAVAFHWRRGRSYEKNKRENRKKLARGTTSARKGSRKPVDLVEIRQQIASLVGNDAVGMVEVTMEEVEKGHYLGMKYLFEMIGLYPAAGEDGVVVPDTMAAILLRRLGSRNRRRRSRQLRKISQRRLRFRMRRA
jgi:hypothetical protein